MIISRTYISRTGSLVHIVRKLRCSTSQSLLTYDLQGQMFFDDAFSNKVMALSPYSGNKNTRSYNSGDSIEAQAMADGYSAMVEYVSYF